MERALRNEVVAFVQKQSALPLVKLIAGNGVNPFDELVSVSKTAESISEIELYVEDAFECLVRAIGMKEEDSDKEVMMDVVDGLKRDFEREIRFFKLVEESKFKDALLEAVRLEAPQLLEQCQVLEE